QVGIHVDCDWLMLVLFFFSSRRRHTRFSRDWSSDVCSSDLALAELARQPVPDVVLRAYGLKALSFGPDYIIPKPFDPRALSWVAPAVARAAMETGVARVQLDIDEYRRVRVGRVG